MERLRAAARGLTLAAALLLAPGGPAWADAAELEARLLVLINETRTAHALPALHADPALAEAARRHAAELAATRRLDHRSADGSDLGRRLARAGYDYVRAAENLAAAPPDPGLILSLWLESPTHRVNLMAPGYSAAGIACAPGATRSYWVLILGAAR